MATRFLLDGMLGSLARWLRISGLDSEYHRDMDDTKLLIEAEKSGRILVTRDHELYLRANKQEIQTYYVLNNEIELQIGELVNEYNLELNPYASRCPKCNEDLVKVEKSEISSDVPRASLDAFELFWKCSECGSVYWQGSHWTQILETLEKATREKSVNSKSL